MTSAFSFCSPVNAFCLHLHLWPRMNESMILEEKIPQILNPSSFVGMRPSPNTYLEETKLSQHVQNTMTPRAMLFGVRALTPPVVILCFYFIFPVLFSHYPILQHQLQARQAHYHNSSLLSAYEPGLPCPISQTEN